ncbi:MAG: hypothetical protein BroJett025_03140 [Patescibacteria group bacterium]|nr:MAG: hypothetical protein BroJett025_03140 [Patescibacteria group bacterium]
MRKINSIIFISILIGFFLILSQKSKKNQTEVFIEPAEPSPTPFTQYQVPKIPNKKETTIIFVGDSMTLALGPHPSYFSGLMNDKFDKIFAIDNYSEGSVSVLSLDRLLKEKTNIGELKENPIINRKFDIIIIESFGHNPLSQFPLDEGLARQEEVLDAAMIELINTRPESVIIFLATIAPDEVNYANTSVGLSTESSKEFAIERKKYIENFIAYAREHSIPLVNIYEQSFTADGRVKPELINPDDNIHPSQLGIELIQTAVFNHIVENNYLTE